MAIRTIENTRLKLELDGGMDGDKQIIKSKTFSRVNLKQIMKIYIKKLCP